VDGEPNPGRQIAAAMSGEPAAPPGKRAVKIVVFDVHPTGTEVPVQEWMHMANPETPGVTFDFGVGPDGLFVKSGQTGNVAALPWGRLFQLALMHGIDVPMPPAKPRLIVPGGGGGRIEIAGG
jgi:hypothetical protein